MGQSLPAPRLAGDLHDGLRLQALTPRRRRATLAVAIGAIALDTALLGLIAPLLPEIEGRTGTGDAGLGLALAAYALPIPFVSIPFGRIADARGRRPLLLAGLLLTIAGSLLIVASHSLAPLVAGRAVQGLGSAASWIAALATVSDLAPEGRRGESIGFALAANSVGSIAGPALGGIGSDAMGFVAPFLIVAGAGAVFFVAGLAVLPRTRPRPSSGGEAWRRLSGTVGQPAVRAATAISIGGAAAIGLIEVVVPLDLDARLGLSASAIGVLFATTILLDAATSPIAGRRGDAIGRRPVARVGLAVLTASFVLFATVGGTAGAAIALCVFGVGISAAFAAAVPWLDESFGELDRGLAYGGLNLIYAVGYSIGPLAGGLLLELGSADLAYLTVAALTLAGLLLMSRPDRPRERAKTAG